MKVYFLFLYCVTYTVDSGCYAHLAVRRMLFVKRILFTLYLVSFIKRISKSVKSGQNKTSRRKTKPSDVDSNSYAAISAPRTVPNECALIRNWAWLQFYKCTLFINHILPCSLQVHALNNHSLRYVTSRSSLLIV